MINSSHLNIITPQKTYFYTQDATQVKYRKGRFEPSKTVKDMLDQLKRVHDYQFHKPVEFLSLHDLSFLENDIEVISTHIQSFDIPDLLRKFELIAVEKSAYDGEIREYLAEELNIELDFVFPVIAVLSYKKMHKICVEDALSELFSMSVLKSVCEICAFGVEEPVDKVKAVEFHNASLIKSIISLNDSTEGDDSIIDPRYSPRVVSSSTESESVGNADVMRKVKDDVENCVQSSKKSDIFNPFMSDTSSDESKTSISKKHQNIDFRDIIP